MTNRGTCLALAAVTILAFAPAVEAQARARTAREQPATVQSGRRPQSPVSGQQPRPAGRGNADRVAPQGFSVVLVLGDLQTGTIQDTVPAAARKALADMKDFLPYKGYRLLDVQWTLCCGRGSSSQAVSRLRGADGKEYELTLATNMDSRDRLDVRFVLREPAEGSKGDEPASEAAVQLEREVVRLEQELQRARETAQSKFEVGVGGPPNEDKGIQNMQSRIVELKIRLAETRDRRVAQSRKLSSAHRAVIDTSFTMDIGETVVVGTSRLAGGDKALIALLTAVANR